VPLGPQPGSLKIACSRILLVGMCHADYRNHAETVTITAI
jgi:hypothetical protein